MTEGQSCPVCLPSGDAAIRFWQGGPKWPVTALEVVGTAALRGLLLASGLYLAGARDKELVKYTLAGTAAIETFVLAWAGYNVFKNK